MFFKNKIITLCLLALSLVVTGTILETGCGTNAPTKAAQAEQPIIHTVNDAVSVLVTQINAGKLTRAQCNQFKVTYQSYYAAQQVLRAVIEKANAAVPTATVADISTANNAVQVAEQQLINFANQFIF